MKANFHTHTERCNHAGGSDQHYVDKAIEAGIEVLGFSDHTPYVGFEGDYYSFYRMYPHQLEDYVNSINSLREQYKEKIEIHLGLEAEYYPKLFDGLLEFIKPYGIEYLILGQHFIDDDQFGTYAGSINDEKLLIEHTDQCIEALETGLFSYLAHPDLPRFDRSHPAFKREMRRLCEASNRLGLPVEINMLGISGGRHYPCDEFLEVVAECNSTVIIGADAHLPEQLTDQRVIEKVREIIDRYNFKVTETIALDRLEKYYAQNP